MQEPEQFKPLRKIENIQTGTFQKTNTNYMQIIQDSQYYDNLEMIKESLKYLSILYVSKITPYQLQERIDYIIKGIENTIEQGYKLVK